MARDINRKKDEILFYENKYKILNPTLTEVEQSELQKTLEKSAKEKSESITMNTKNAAASSSSSAFAEKARNENNTANLPATEHVILAQPYDTQVLSYAERLWSEIVHLGQTIAYFYNSILEGNKPNKDLRDQNERIKNYELYGIHPNLRQLILAYAYNHIVYPVQDFITSKDNNIILRSIGFICYIPFFFTYKITWAFANFPTLLETLEESVDALGKGVHNLSESLIGSKNDSLFSLVLFKPLKKAVVTPFLTVGKGVFGFLYWILWPFANGGTMRKAARMLVWRPFAEPVDRACDVLDPLYNYLCKWEEKLDDKSFEWRDLGEYFLIYLGYFGLLFPYGLIQLYLLPTAAFCWFINDVIKPIFFSIPIVSAIFSLVYSFIRNETHDLAEKKVDDVKSTIGTKFSIFFQRFFVQPYKNTWSWFKTEWNEVDRLNKINYYGKHALWGDNTGIKYAFRADLIGKLILASVGNFFLGIAYSIMTFLKQAPVLTFISFSTSTLAAGATLPIIGTLAFHETISGYLMIAPMVFEPVNTTRDKYNNAMAQKFVKAQHELKTPVKFYRRFIRHYLLKKLAAAGYTNLNSDGRATNKDDPRYQIALTELETRTYARMPRVPMDECDVKEHLDKLFSGDHPISMENLVPDDLTNVTFAEQKVEKHNHRVKWATECIEYAFYVNRGKEIWKDTKTHMPSDTIIKSQETKDLENSSQDTIKDKMAIAFSTFKDYLNSFIDIKLNEKINENTHEAYKIFLANLLADLFSVNEEARNKHLEYFLKNDDLNTVIDYFFGQYQISDDFEGLSEHYKEDCKYAFVGFAEMVADRFTQVASEERYRRSLMKSPARIFYIDKNGAAIPCIDTLDTNGILKLEFIENGVQKNVTFISRESNLHVDSPLIHNRYDEGVKSNDDIQMDHFIYSQNNCHIDLNLTMAALAKDFDKIETPKNNEEHNDTQPNPKANSSCTRMPVLNFKQGYDAKTPSACHLNNAYNAPALPKWKDHQETKLTDNKIVISEYEGNGSDKMETEEPEIIPEEKWPTKNSYPQFRTMLKTLSLQAPVLPSEPNHLRKITNKAL